MLQGSVSLCLCLKKICIPNTFYCMYLLMKFRKSLISKLCRRNGQIVRLIKTWADHVKTPRGRAGILRQLGYLCKATTVSVHAAKTFNIHIHLYTEIDSREKYLVSNGLMEPALLWSLASCFHHLMILIMESWILLKMDEIDFASWAVCCLPGLHAKPRLINEIIRRPCC